MRNGRLRRRLSSRSVSTIWSPSAKISSAWPRMRSPASVSARRRPLRRNRVTPSAPSKVASCALIECGASPSTRPASAMVPTRATVQK